MNNVTLLTLLRMLVTKRVISSKEAEDISCVEQVSDILKSKGVCDDTDFITIDHHYRQVINSCRQAVSSSEIGNRRKGLDQFKSILLKEKSFAA